MEAKMKSEDMTGKNQICAMWEKTTFCTFDGEVPRIGEYVLWRDRPHKSGAELYRVDRVVWWYSEESKGLKAICYVNPVSPEEDDIPY
jgi:hypothetical protein